jgi:hypothetical protein
MNRESLNLLLLSEVFCICRLEPGAEIPAWALSGPFASVTRTADEFSVVCPEAVVPAGVRREGAWRCLRVAGRLDFAAVGVLASLVTPLASAGISIFAVSTFDTDYLLVKERDLATAVAALQAAGHQLLQ